MNPAGRLVYSSWFGDLGGGELRMLDHIRATAFTPGRTTALVAQPGPVVDAIVAAGAHAKVNVWKGGKNYAARQWFWYSAWLRCAHMLRQTAPQLVVCNTFFDLESTGHVTGTLRLPLVWRARADTFPIAHQWPARRLQKVVAFLNEKVATIAATTRYEADLMVGAGVNADKVHVIHNGVDLQRYGEATTGLALRQAQGLHRDHFVLAFVARMVPQKGYEVFFDAIAVLKRQGVPVKALVAGDTTLLEESADEYKRGLKTQVERLGLLDDVRFLGFRHDIHAVMHAADVFVSASHVEPFGNTNIEAMAAGKPVVSSDLPGPRESVVADETGLFFPAGDSAALAGQLLRLHGNQPQARQFGEQGRQRAEQVFDLTRNVAALDALCLNVTASAGRHGSTVRSRGR